ncbi:MAG: winged helix-turn-helix domain-containing protein, partial [Gammaproteobacteria bacterium]|nr:winged helix-turn-helix domain-containing protein [Gammaproteobacteria bacterium]
MSEPSVSSLDFMREQPFLVGDWRVEPTSGRIVLGSTEVKLEPRVMDLLLCLASRPGEVFSRVQLESTVWAGMVVGYDSLTSAMIKLRKAFNDDSRNPQIIETVSKRGYRLLAKVSFDPPQAGRVIEETSQVTIKEESPRRRLHHYSTFAIVSCLLLMALWFFIKEESPTRPQAIGDTPERVGLVVLPFINMNDDPSQEYFSDGITDDLIVDLSRYSGLLVIARRSAFSYKSRNADIPTLARELNVGYVVEGSVRRDHDKVRVNVQLVDTATGMNIWVQRFEERTDDLFSVQDDIRKNIIRSLSVKLTEEE